MQDTPRQSPLLGILKGAVIAIGALLPGISGGALCVIHPKKGNKCFP